MKLTVFGIAVLSVGTYLTLTEKWKVVGVVLIALGTLLIAIAQRRDSQSDTRRLEATIQQKITEVHQEIASAKALPSASESAKNKLDQIDRTFTDWARGFVQNKERRKLEIEQTRVADLQTQLDKSETWRPVLELFLRTVSGAARAYSKETGSSIPVHLPKLPPNLYDKTASYDGRVSFSKTVSWRIQLDRHLEFLGEFPAMVVTLIRGDDDDMLVRIWSINRDRDFVKLSFSSDLLPKLSGIDGNFSKANFQQELPKAIMRLFEAQILSLENHAI